MISYGYDMDTDRYTVYILIAHITLFRKFFQTSFLFLFFYMNSRYDYYDNE